jgi:hypothetical protein
MKTPPRDPIGTFARKSAARRRTGNRMRCVCGETRAEALIKNTGICVECERKAKGHGVLDTHHVAGRANSSVVVRVPANDHRAELSDAQRDWPKATLENPRESPLLTAAACTRGFIDTARYLIEQLLSWVAEMLEILDEILVERLGPEWWLDTPLARLTRKE